MNTLITIYDTIQYNFIHPRREIKEMKTSFKKWHELIIDLIEPAGLLDWLVVWCPS